MKIYQLGVVVRPWFCPLAGMVFSALVGCQPVQVQSEFGPASFAGFGTSFAWLPAATVAGDPLLSDPSLNEFIRESIQGQLEAKGYQRRSPPDGFYITYRITSRQILKDPYYNPKVYKEGSLIIITVHPKTKKLMWRGSTSSLIEPSLPPSRRMEKIREAVGAILARLPDQGKS